MLETINMLSWWQWLLIGAVPPAIIALYFLKLKREPLEVPSTYLWHKSIEDLHVNSIWQRLRKSLLLLLQLLLLALAMIALLRPSWHGATRPGERSIFLIDNSASMTATDVDGTRLAEAKRQTLALVDQMRSGDKAMLISFSDNAQVMQEFTDNRRLLRRRVEAIEPTYRTTSLLTALRLASGLANPGRSASDTTDAAVAEALPATVYIFSDGKFPDVHGFSLGHLTPLFVPIGKPDAGNVAITAFSTRRNESRAERLQAFAMLENFTADPVEATVDLYVDKELVDSKRVPIPAGKSQGVDFDLENIEAGKLTLKLPAPDALPVDNVAYATVNNPHRGRVLCVTPGNRALEWALSTTRSTEMADVSIAKPAVLATKAYLEDAAAGNYDLVIYDQCQPKKLPQCNTVFIGRVPPAELPPTVESTTGKAAADKPAAGESASGKVAPSQPPNDWSRTTDDKVVAPAIIDTDRAHPLMQLVELGNVEIAESLALVPPPGATTLVDSAAGKLMVIAPRDGFEDLVLGFELFGVSAKGERYSNTNWPLRLSFPTFVFNVLQYLGGQEHSQASTSVLPGQTVSLRSSVAQQNQIQVINPRGKAQAVPRGKQNSFPYNATDEPGIYEVRESGKTTQRFSVNVFDGLESNVAPRPEKGIQIGYVDVAANAGFEPTRHEAWKMLMLGAMAVLLAEWYIYNRRVYL